MVKRCNLGGTYYGCPILTFNEYSVVSQITRIFPLVTNSLPFYEFSHPVYLSVTVRGWLVSNVIPEKLVICDLFWKGTSECSDRLHHTNYAIFMFSVLVAHVYLNIIHFWWPKLVLLYYTNWKLN
jgi:hypothetical protein